FPYTTLFRSDRDAAFGDIGAGWNHDLDSALLSRSLVQVGHRGIQLYVPFRHAPFVVQLGSLDFLDQHGRDERLPMLRLEREARDEVGLRGEQMKRRAKLASFGNIHDKLLEINGSSCRR